MLRLNLATTLLCLLATGCQLETFDLAIEENTEPKPASKSLCGNGSIDNTEICDDGNSETETSCDYGIADCVSCNDNCSAELTLTGPYCGDGFLDPEEICDDGNSVQEMECEYGSRSCSACGEDCQQETQLVGGYCGDNICQPEELPSQCREDCNAIHTLPLCNDTLEESFSLNNIDPPIPNSNGYEPPGLTVEQLITISVDILIFSTDANAARESVEQGPGSDFDYILCRDPEDIMVARWEPRLEGKGSARFALRLGNARPAIVGIPHGKYENLVMRQGVELFQNLGLRALIVNGSHRCANQDGGTCSGTTSVCGEQGPYRTSDVAHVDNTIFQWAHEIFTSRFSTDLVLSIHGKFGSGINLSNGTKNETNENSPIAKLVLALNSILSQEQESIRSCNPFPGAPQITNNLCGTTNIQGRMLNFSPAPCSQGAPLASDRFIYIEQSADIRSNYRTYIESALSSVIPD